MFEDVWVRSHDFCLEGQKHKKIFVDEQLSYSKSLDCSKCCCYLIDWLYATQRKKFAFLEWIEHILRRTDFYGNYTN